MNIVKIYKEKDGTPTFTIEAEDIIDSLIYTKLWDCKEEIYIDEELIDVIYYKK
jgi:hypothetical protein